MQAWAAGIVCLYVCIMLFNWVTGLHWLSDWSLPMTILVGVGLAIASQPDHALDVAKAPKPETTPTVPESIPTQTDLTDLPPEPPIAARPLPEASISFTINQNVRPG